MKKSLKYYFMKFSVTLNQLELKQALKTITDPKISTRKP